MGLNSNGSDAVIGAIRRAIASRTKDLRDSIFLSPRWTRVRAWPRRILQVRMPLRKAFGSSKPDMTTAKTANWSWAVLDIHCGYGEAESDFGYDRFTTSSGDLHGEKAEPPLRLLSLGGSTTSWRYREGSLWARDLANLVSERTGRQVQLFNGGVRGYSSSQELIKLVRDAHSIAPDLVVSLSGINDIGTRYSQPKFPFAHPFAVTHAKGLVARGDFDEVVVGRPLGSTGGR